MSCGLDLRLLVAAERIIRDGARNIKRDVMRIDGESGVGDAKGFGRPASEGYWAFMYYASTFS